MPLTKAEKKTLNGYQKRGTAIRREIRSVAGKAERLAKDVRRFAVKQARKS